MHWLLLFPGCKDKTPHDSDTEPVAVDFPCPEVQPPTLDGSTWTLAADAPGGDILSFIEGSDGLLFAVSTMNGAYRSEDGGLTWSAVQIEISHGAGQGVIDRNGIIYLIVGLGELFQSGDGHSFRPVEALREQGIHGLVEQGNSLFAIDEQAAVWKGSGEVWTEVGQVPVPPVRRTATRTTSSTLPRTGGTWAAPGRGSSPSSRAGISGSATTRPRAGSRPR